MFSNFMFSRVCILQCEPSLLEVFLLRKLFVLDFCSNHNLKVIACSQDILHFIPSDGTVSCETEEYNLFTGSKPRPTKNCAEILSSLALKIEKTQRKTVEFGYPCLRCPKRFKYKEELEKHFDSNHEIFQCKICLLILSNKGNLLRHANICGLADEEILRFACSFCDRSFKRKDKLKDHLVSRHNEPRYKCKLCQFGFEIKSDFQEHKLFCGMKKV